MKRIGVLAIILLAFAGLSDSFYLSLHQASGTPLLCTVQNLTGCNVVAASKYSFLFGIPVANYGIVFYTALFILSALELIAFNRQLRRLLQVFAAVGLLVSLYSTFVQVFFIQALCIYCLASAAITVGIFVLATLIEPLRKKNRVTRVAEPVSEPSEPLTMPPV